MIEFRAPNLTKRQRQLKIFQEELKKLEIRDLTARNVCDITKAALLRMLNPMFRSDKRKVERALSKIKFKPNGDIQVKDHTFREINKTLSTLKTNPQTTANARVLLSAGMHNLGTFNEESLAYIAHNIFIGKSNLSEKNRKRLVGVVAKTASAFMEAHKAAGHVYLTSLKDAKYIYKEEGARKFYE